MKTKERIESMLKELKENINKNVKNRDWKNVISDAEWLEALSWVLD